MHRCRDISPWFDLIALVIGKAEHQSMYILVVQMSSENFSFCLLLDWVYCQSSFFIKCFSSFTVFFSSEISVCFCFIFLMFYTLLLHWTSHFGGYHFPDFIKWFIRVSCSSLSFFRKISLNSLPVSSLTGHVLHPIDGDMFPWWFCGPCNLLI